MPRMLRHAAVLGATAHVASRRGQAKGEAAQQQEAAAAPLKPLPEPVDLEQYRVRRHTRAGGLISEYRLVV